MSSRIVNEVWKPTCREDLMGLYSVLQVRHDRCQRKYGHSGRCVGRYYVWDKNNVREWQERLVQS